MRQQHEIQIGGQASGGVGQVLAGERAAFEGERMRQLCGAADKAVNGHQAVQPCFGKVGEGVAVGFDGVHDGSFGREFGFSGCLWFFRLPCRVRRRLPAIGFPVKNPLRKSIVNNP